MTEDRPQPKATKEWIDACREEPRFAYDAFTRLRDIVGDYFNDIEEGHPAQHTENWLEFWRLTDALVLWCDAVGKSIDPAPFLEFGDQLGEYQLQIFEYRRENPEEAASSFLVLDSFDQLEQSFVKQEKTFYRMYNVFLTLYDEPSHTNPADRERFL